METKIGSDDNSAIGVYTQYTPTNIINKESRLVMISQEAIKKKVDFGPKLDFTSKLQGLNESNHIRCIQTLCTLMKVSVTVKQIITIPDNKNLDKYVLNNIIKSLGKHRITIDPIGTKSF